MNYRAKLANFATVTLPKPALFLLAVVATGGALWGGWRVYQRSFAGWERAKAAQVAGGATAAADKSKLHRVEIHPGPATPAVRARHTTTAGNVAAVACSTCHTTRPANVALTQAAQLKEFHLGLTYRHGELSCLSCHNATNYDTLRRADGTAVAFPQTIALCAQCHGPTYRDYLHGSHGGMNGYWDLQRGPRERNTCTDCHDPHAPLYPRVQPVFPPRDRGAQQQQARLHAAH